MNRGARAGTRSGLDDPASPARGSRRGRVTRGGDPDGSSHRTTAVTAGRDSIVTTSRSWRRRVAVASVGVVVVVLLTRAVWNTARGRDRSVAADLDTSARPPALDRDGAKVAARPSQDTLTLRHGGAVQFPAGEAIDTESRPAMAPAPPVIPGVVRTDPPVAGVGQSKMCSNTLPPRADAAAGGTTWLDRLTRAVGGSDVATGKQTLRATGQADNGKPSWVVPLLQRRAREAVVTHARKRVQPLRDVVDGAECFADPDPVQMPSLLSVCVVRNAHVVGHFEERGSRGVTVTIPGVSPGSPLAAMLRERGVVLVHDAPGEPATGGAAEPSGSPTGAHDESAKADVGPKTMIVTPVTPSMRDWLSGVAWAVRYQTQSHWIGAPPATLWLDAQPPHTAGSGEGWRMHMRGALSIFGGVQLADAISVPVGTVVDLATPAPQSIAALASLELDEEAADYAGAIEWAGRAAALTLLTELHRGSTRQLCDSVATSAHMSTSPHAGCSAVLVGDWWHSHFGVVGAAAPEREHVKRCAQAASHATLAIVPHTTLMSEAWSRAQAPLPMGHEQASERDAGAATSGSGSGTPALVALVGRAAVDSTAQAAVTCFGDAVPSVEVILDENTWVSAVETLAHHDVAIITTDDEEHLSVESWMRPCGVALRFDVEGAAGDRGAGRRPGTRLSGTVRRSGAEEGPPRPSQELCDMVHSVLDQRALCLRALRDAASDVSMATAAGTRYADDGTTAAPGLDVLGYSPADAAAGPSDASGDNGTCWRTTVAGVPWHQMTTQAVEALRDVQGLGEGRERGTAALALQDTELQPGVDDTAAPPVHTVLYSGGVRHASHMCGVDARGNGGRDEKWHDAALLTTVGTEHACAAGHLVVVRQAWSATARHGEASDNPLESAVNVLRALELGGATMTSHCWTCVPRVYSAWPGCNALSPQVAEDAVAPAHDAPGFCAAMEPVAGQVASSWVLACLMQGDAAGATDVVKQLLTVLTLFRRVGLCHGNLHLRTSLVVRGPGGYQDSALQSTGASRDAGVVVDDDWLLKAQAGEDARAAAAAAAAATMAAAALQNDRSGAASASAGVVNATDADADNAAAPPGTDGSELADTSLIAALASVSRIVSGGNIADPWVLGQPENELVVTEFWGASLPSASPADVRGALTAQTVEGRDVRTAGEPTDHAHDVWAAIANLLGPSHASGLLTLPMQRVWNATSATLDRRREGDPRVLLELLASG